MVHAGFGFVLLCIKCAAVCLQHHASCARKGAGVHQRGNCMHVSKHNLVVQHLLMLRILGLGSTIVGFLSSAAATPCGTLGACLLAGRGGGMSDEWMLQSLAFACMTACHWTYVSSCLLWVGWCQEMSAAVATLAHVHCVQKQLYVHRALCVCSSGVPDVAQPGTQFSMLLTCIGGLPPFDPCMVFDSVVAYGSARYGVQHLSVAQECIAANESIMGVRRALLPVRNQSAVTAITPLAGHCQGLLTSHGKDSKGCHMCMTGSLRGCDQCDTFRRSPNAKFWAVLRHLPEVWSCALTWQYRISSLVLYGHWGALLDAGENPRPFWYLSVFFMYKHVFHIVRQQQHVSV
ncbi:hypothetical protein COO60DRAFT_1504218 [Scenedesmus sp. NREL 46B-D3]|nr:hypothetical protein COO60DRAFT_1504218 [Scenedesmus sp. NREL 46B-D3]